MSFVTPSTMINKTNSKKIIITKYLFDMIDCSVKLLLIDVYDDYNKKFDIFKVRRFSYRIMCFPTGRYEICTRLKAKKLTSKRLRVCKKKNNINAIVLNI